MFSKFIKILYVKCSKNTYKKYFVVIYYNCLEEMRMSHIKPTKLNDTGVLISNLC